ncbi:uncharacterized protein RJT20DRAFT_55683 [Scheffersomyces xylosifermentans]|uniref:uncharacterized protein n=1 Tax=Scheffersomyces xylosifermentans TaxID=1304137 RepID=UPI00315CB9B2
MEKSFDEIQSISSLLHSLTIQLTDSSDHITKLQKLATDLVSSEQYDSLSQPQPGSDDSKKITELTPEDEENLMIQLLEKERLSLVLEVQKHDFLGEKLVELVDQNEDIVETVKEYLQSKDAIRREEEDFAKRRFDNYMDNILQPTIDQLDSNLFDLYTGVHRIQESLKEFSSTTTKAEEKLLSKQYQDDLNSLVGSLNSILKRFKDPGAHDEQEANDIEPSDLKLLSSLN